MRAGRWARRSPPITIISGASARTASTTIDGDATAAYLGPELQPAGDRARLDDAGARFEVLDDDGPDRRTVDALVERARRSAGSRAAWSSGRARSARRSILGDPRSPTMQKPLNLKVKYRESFRPFAPSVLREDVADWFELDEDSPYMLLVADVVGATAPRHD